MAFPALKEAQEKLTEKQKNLHGVFEEAGPDMDMDKIKSIDGDRKAKVDQIRAWNEELDELGAKVDELRLLDEAATKARARGEESPGDDQDHEKSAEHKSVGELLTDSIAFKNKSGSSGPEAHLDIELKTLLESSTGWVPETVRGPRVVDYATRPLQVVDLFPQRPTSQTSVVYMEETTFTNNAAEIAEAAAYPEAALALEEKSSPVRKIGVFLPVTDEQLEDVPGARGYVNNRLPFMVRQRLDSQLLVGDGTAPNLSGLLDVVGIQTQAKGADPTPDAAYKLMTKIKTTGQAMPNAFVFNPLDWQDIRLLRTADGIYIWGSPSEAAPARLWGLNVAEAQGLTENTGVCGDFQNFSELAVKRGMDVQISNSHSDYFVKGKQAIRADIRVAVVFYRPAAFGTITGI